MRATLTLKQPVAIKPPVAPTAPLAQPFGPAQAPWIRPGVVVHEASTLVDALLAKFARAIRERGFTVTGCVRCAEGGQLLDLANDQRIAFDPTTESTAVAERMRAAMRDDADLVAISHFSAMERASRQLMASVNEGTAQGMPVLTSIPGEEIHTWLEFAGQDGAIMAPNMKALWRWWGPERLYRDLSLGVAEDEVRQIACGQRWIMVEGPYGAGLAYLPRYPKDLLPRLPSLARQSLKSLARLSSSWDPVEMALGIAAINAHYNRTDLAGRMGNGADLFKEEQGRVVAVGAFPGLSSVLPNCSVIETDPRPGEYPTVAMDSLLPGCAAAVVNSSTLINRNLPRILRAALGSRVALVGPSTPMTERLHHYGVEILGGLVVRDPKGLAAMVKGGGTPREFGQFGQYLHLRKETGEVHRPCRFRATQP